MATTATAKVKFETLLYTVEDGIATITLNRPDKLNAFNGEMTQELIKAYDVTDGDDNVKAVILTGAGRAFCSGADLSGGGFGARSAEQLAAAGVAPLGPGEIRRDGAGLVTLRMYDSLKPIICCANGVSVGVGVTMQLAADIRLASTEARFQFAFARRGIVPEGCSTFFLPRLVGMDTALEWSMSGRMFNAQEALEKGLVRAVLPPADLIPAAKAIAREIIDNAAPVSVALMRQMFWRMLGAAHPMEAHRVESRALNWRFPSDDAREGVASWMEKRAPKFPDSVSAMPDIWPGYPTPKF